MSDDIVLNLLKEVRDDLKQYTTKTEIHESKLKDILGNGQPGRLTKVESAVEELDRMKWKLIGFSIGIVLLMEGGHIGFAEVVKILAH